MNRPKYASARKSFRPAANPNQLFQIEDLYANLQRLDGASYGAYKSLVGTYAADGFDLTIYRVQSDPYAPPSQVAVRLDVSQMEVPPELTETKSQQVAVADFFARTFYQELGAFRDLRMAAPSQQILERSYAQISEGTLELRFQMQLPARGRTILGRQARRIVSEDIPAAVERALYDFDLAKLRQQVNTYQDYLQLRHLLKENDLVAFVADGSVLARASGISDLPLPEAIVTRSPHSLTRTFTLPHAKEVTGMAIPRGITVIVGGGYHGKSTLLAALAKGVYAHIPGDGRELVATDPSACFIRAEDGRCVNAVDVRAFINNLPGGRSTESFSTQNASGSTSQAAAIIEALEAGATTLLIDEDTSATNLMIRDRRMRQLVSDQHEPITALVDRIGALRSRGTSTILVMGGSGDYLDQADLVLEMNEYQIEDASQRAQKVCQELPRPRQDLPETDVFDGLQRVPLPQPSGSRGRKVKSRRTDLITLDREEIDVSALSQLVDSGQTEAVANALAWCLEKGFDGKKTLREVLAEIQQGLDETGFAAITSQFAPAFLVRPRMLEVAAAINRYRQLQIRRK